MPKLPTYTAQLADQSSSGGRRATADDFGGAPAAALGGVAKTAEKAYDDIGDAESRKALVTSTEIRAKYAKALDDAAQSGADLAPIKASMNDELSKVGESFYTAKGQSSSQLYTAQSNQMFEQQSNAIAVHRATVDAQIEGKKFLTSTAALINTNPAYLDVAIKDTDNFTESLTHASPEVKKEINQKLKNELNVSAAVSMARLAPEEAKRMLDEGKWELTPEQRSTAYFTAERTIRENRADDALIRAEDARQKKDLNDTGRDEQFANIINGTATQGSIMNDARLDATTREHLIDLKERRAKELANTEKVSDPTTKRDLWLAINAPDGDPSKIYNADPIFAAVQSGKLSTTDANGLNALVANQKDENGKSFATRLQGRLSTINVDMRTSPVYQAQPDLAAAIQNEMVTQVERLSAQMRKANQNPDGLLDPSSKDYYFKPDRIKQTADDVQAQIRAARPPVPDMRVDADSPLNVPVGGYYIDPKGATRQQTQESLDAFKALKTPGKTSEPAAPAVPRVHGNTVTVAPDIRPDSIHGQTTKAVPAAPPVVGTPLAPQPAAQNGPDVVIPPDVQAERDAKRLEILKSERKDNPDDKNLKREIEIQENRQDLYKAYDEASDDYQRVLKDPKSTNAEQTAAKAKADAAFKKYEHAKGGR